jgi:hypothetical protein
MLNQILKNEYLLGDTSSSLGSLLVYRLGIDAASGASAKHTRPEHPPLLAKPRPRRSCSHSLRCNRHQGITLGSFQGGIFV